MQRLSCWTQRTSSSWLLWTTKAFGSMLLIVFLVCFGPSFDPGKMDPWGGYAFAKGGDDGGDDDSDGDSGSDDDGDSDDSGSDSSGDDDGDSDDSGSDSSGDDDGDSDDSGSDSSGDDDGDSDDSGSDSSSDDDDSSGGHRSGHDGESEDDGFDRRRGADSPEDGGIHQHRGGQIDDVRRVSNNSRKRIKPLILPDGSHGSVDDSSSGQVEAGDDKGGQRQLRGLGVIDDLSEVSPEEESSLLGKWQN